MVGKNKSNSCRNTRHHNKTPSDFSDKEAIQYEQDYKSAVADFLNEFDKDKNLWDRFLDLLDGGTHQLPSGL